LIGLESQFVTAIAQV